MRADPGPPPHAIRARRHLLALLAALLAVLLAPALAAAAAGWSRPVQGDVVRPFRYSAGSPFAARAHRGADLAAPPGARVAAACAGRVLFAGDVAAAGRVVTVACGGRRVTYLPLAAVAVRAGTRIAGGSLIGTVAAGHSGLHLGVRRAGDRFAYEDPLPLLEDGRVGAPVLLPRVRPSRPPTMDALPTVSPVATARTSSPRALAPWSVWAGLALVLAGCCGSGVALAARRRRTMGRVPVAAARSGG